MNALHDFGLLTLADVAELLHCSKAHVCNAVAGPCAGLPAHSCRVARSPKARAPRIPALVDRAKRTGRDATIPASPVRGPQTRIRRN